MNQNLQEPLPLRSATPQWICGDHTNMAAIGYIYAWRMKAPFAFTFFIFSKFIIRERIIIYNGFMATPELGHRSTVTHCEEGLKRLELVQ